MPVPVFAISRRAMVYPGSMGLVGTRRFVVHPAGEDQTAAIGEGLAAVAYALLEVAQAIRDDTESRR